MQIRSKNFDETQLVIIYPILARANLVSQEIQRFSNSNAVPSCSICGSSQNNLLRMLDRFLHAVRMDAGYGIFRKWASKPANQEGWRQQKQINQLLLSPHLSQWQQKILLGVQYGRSLSPKKQQVLPQIEAQVGGQG